MSDKVHLLMTPGENSYPFPKDICTFCGEKAWTKLTYKNQSRRLISRTGDAMVKQMTYWQYKVNLEIPYCWEHLGVSKATKPVTAAAAVLGFLLGAVGVSVIARLMGRDALSTSTNKELVGTLLALVVIGCVCGGILLVSWLAKIIMTRFYSDAFKHVPIWAWFDDDITRPRPLGLGVKLEEETLTLTFDNPQAAAEFKRLNGLGSPSS